MPIAPDRSRWIALFIEELLRIKPALHPALATDDAAFAYGHMQAFAPDEAAHVWLAEERGADSVT